MGAHVPAVGQEGHGAEQQAGKNFYDHHGDGEQNDAQGIALAVLVGLVKAVLVLPFVEIIDMHG